MRDIVHSYVRKFREERRERRKFLGVLLLLALAVGSGIMWQFKTTGIAYTNEAQCGIEEHTHSDECYAYVLTEDGSSQKTAAEEASEVLSAVVEEVTAIESKAAETQDAAAEAADETSQAAESGESVEAAVESETAAVKSTGSTDAAISEEALPAQVLLTEAAETEDWYLSHGYEKVLICGKEEHIHTIECLSDETADLEKAEVWETTLPSLTGVWADDVVAIAESQVGYAESTLNFTLAEDGITRKGYNRYGAWYGNAYGDWDAMFAAFCLHYAGVSENDFPVNSGAYAWSVSLKEAGLYQTAGSFTPAAGDLAFLDKDQDGTVDTVAVITSVNDTTLTVVEGNSNDVVEKNIYEISDGVVTGYGVLPKQDEDSLTGLTKTYTAEAETEDGSVIVTVTAPYGALPDDAVLSVTLYEEDSDEYAAAAETIGYEPETAQVVATEDGIVLASEDDTETETVAISGLAVLDICFMVGDEEVEPSEAVTVSIDASAIIPEEADASTIEVQHLTETVDGVETTLVADITEETNGTVDTESVIAEFEVGSFSTFTITWSSGNGYNAASTSITATTYLYGTSTTIGSGSTSLTGTSGTAFNLTSSNSDLAIDGYTLVSASVTYDGTTYSGVTAVTVTASESWGNKSYGYSYTDSTGSHSLYSGNNTQTVTISLYYKENAGITISATGDDTNGYKLIATTAGSSTYSYTNTTWSISDNTVAEMTVNGDGTVAIKWAESAKSGDTVTVTVSSTAADSEGNEQTVTDSYTLTNGTVSTTVTVTLNSSGVSGANVALVDSNGDIVASGTTDSNGQVTFTVLPGTYTVEVTFTTTTSSEWGGTSTSVYGGSGSLAVTQDGGSTTVTLSSQSTYNHVDIEVSGTYTLTLDDGTEVNLSTYVYDGNSIQVTLPDGTTLSGTAEYSNGSGQTEYRYENITISAQWDGSTYSGTTTYMNGSFTLSGYVLISVSEVADSGLTEAQIESIFGSYEIITVTSGSSSSVGAGSYYKITFSGYHPEYNVCIGSSSSSGQMGGSRGYDFEIDINKLLMALSDKLIVTKYVIDENGNVISAEDNDQSFTFTLNTSSGSAVGSTSLQSEGSYTFEDIEKGYYYVEETAVSGYYPVSVSYDEDGNIVLSEAGYIQYVQNETKEDGTIATVTYYNLKLDELGVVKLQKSVDDSSATGNYSSETFTFMLFDSDGDASSLNNIEVTTSDGKEFYLAAGTYTIIELASELKDGDSQTVYINGTALTRTVADANDAYGLDEGTVYYIGTIIVTAGSSLTYTVTNTYTSSVDITLKKVSNDNTPVALKGAIFTLTASGATDGTSYTTGESGTVTMTGLSDGTYILTETDAPDGYNLLTSDITFLISGGKVTSATYGTGSSSGVVSVSEDGLTITVVNTAGAVLPSTGGTGTYLYTLAGLLLILSAVCLMYKNLRRKGDLPY